MTSVIRLFGPGPVVGGRRLPPLPIAMLIVAAVVANAWYLAWTLVDLIASPAAFDWNMFVESGRRVHEGGLYTHDPSYLFRWSPVAAWLFSVIGVIGTLAWRLLHLAAILLVPDRGLQLLVLVSWPFWVDLEAGNIMTFVFVAAIWALRGNTLGMVAFVALFLLAPRPLQLPVLLWILVTRPAWRVPIALLTVAHFGLVAASGWGTEWASALLGTATPELDNDTNVGPSQLIGAIWIPIGLALGGWLTLRGRLGWASLAVSPYWLPMYLLMGFLEFHRRRLWLRWADTHDPELDRIHGSPSPSTA